jgi:hypothetical protein
MAHQFEFKEKHAMIEFTHATTRYTVKPENAQEYRAALNKTAKHKPVATSSKNLTRQYPAFLAGCTTTADYVSRFQSQFDGVQHRIQHGCANYYENARALDPSIPEVFEELDPDYVYTPTKAKKQTVASLKAAIAQALESLKQGDTDTAQCVLNEAIR